MERMRFRIATLGLLSISAILYCGKAVPSGPSDLSGTWNADLVKSRFVAGAPRPKKLILTIEQEGQKLVRRETSVTGSQSTETSMILTPDGQEYRNDLPDGGPTVTSKCRWEGSSLIIEGSMVMSPTEKTTWMEKLTLSRNRKTLRATLSIKFAIGSSNDTDITFIRPK